MSFFRTIFVNPVIVVFVVVVCLLLLSNKSGCFIPVECFLACCCSRGTLIVMSYSHLTCFNFVLFHLDLCYVLFFLLLSSILSIDLFLYNVCV